MLSPSLASINSFISSPCMPLMSSESAAVGSKDDCPVRRKDCDEDDEGHEDEVERRSVS